MGTVVFSTHPPQFRDEGDMYHGSSTSSLPSGRSRVRFNEDGTLKGVLKNNGSGYPKWTTNLYWNNFFAVFMCKLYKLWTDLNEGVLKKKKKRKEKWLRKRKWREKVFSVCFVLLFKLQFLQTLNYCFSVQFQKSIEKVSLYDKKMLLMKNNFFLSFKCRLNKIFRSLICVWYEHFDSDES